MSYCEHCECDSCRTQRVADRLEGKPEPPADMAEQMLAYLQLLKAQEQRRYWQEEMARQMPNVYRTMWASSTSSNNTQWEVPL